MVSYLSRPADHDDYIRRKTGFMLLFSTLYSILHHTHKALDIQLNVNLFPGFISTSSLALSLPRLFV
jgi:hypothetical protein